ncbi:lysylphosphatidylglycerol synthase transmembrane domain-containing protein [candidate division CSSED10-310 bacterium]|uniref:Lysylphosphatidylglycerol synthase transmembrane domain-containing protein n=1 Tax=candidate division CSSED10-310 bacterium TaxID=2855610 RepID=A0ABV6YU22_UNCC1
MNTLKILAKISFSASVVFFLLWKKVDVHGIINALSQASIGWIMLSFLLHPVGLFISTHRWHLLLQAQAINVSMNRLYLSYLVCGFFNQFLPTRVGGDLIRVYDTKVMGYSGSKSFAVVFVERGSGILMLFLLALVAATYRLCQGSTDLLYWAGLSVGLAGLGSVILVCHPVPISYFTRFISWLNMERLNSRLTTFNETTVSYWRKGKQKQFKVAFFLAFLLQINVVLHYYFLGLAFTFHQGLPFFEYFIIIPLVQVILMFPFFINGIGLREVSWIYLLGLYGLSSDTAFAYSLLDFTMYLIFGILGGIIYALRR